MKKTILVNKKLVFILIAIAMITMIYAPVVSSMGCSGCSWDPHYWAYQGHWEYHYYKEYIDVDPDSWFIWEQIDGIDENGYYYWRVEKHWVIDWDGVQEDQIIYHN